MLIRVVMGLVVMDLTNNIIFPVHHELTAPVPMKQKDQRIILQRFAANNNWLMKGDLDLEYKHVLCKNPHQSINISTDGSWLITYYYCILSAFSLGQA